jgi:predicted GIY-YIG superfamily endonuclease
MWVSGTQDSGSIPDRTTIQATMYFVYILQSEVDHSYYRGHTNDLIDRIGRHNRMEEEYTRKLAPWILV